MATSDEVYLNDCPEISLVSHVSLASASNPRIYYTKPDGTTGYWAATISGENVIYQVLASGLNMLGVWRLQAYVEVGGLPYHGATVRLKVLSLYVP